MPCGAEFGYIVPHPGMPSGIVDGPNEMRRKVRELVRAGAASSRSPHRVGCSRRRTIHATRTSGEDELRALVAEAGHAEIPVMAHCHSGAGPGRRCALGPAHPAGRVTRPSAGT